MTQQEERQAGLIAPERTSIQVWDTVVGVALIFTGLFTPFEVSFLPAYCPPHYLFIFNRVIDLLFFFDMLLQFSLITITETPDGVERITNRPQLARNYLSGWFAIDLVSIAPFDSVGCAFRSEDVQMLKVFRVVRLLR